MLDLLPRAAQKPEFSTEIMLQNTSYENAKNHFFFLTNLIDSGENRRLYSSNGAQHRLILAVVRAAFGIVGGILTGSFGMFFLFSEF